MNRLKKWIAFFCVITMIVSFFTGCGSFASKDIEEKDIVILFTNDIHCNGENKAGYAGIMAYKKECMEKTPYVSLVDCGDAMKGDMLGVIREEKYIVSVLNMLMNKLEYDLAAFGNHEFDFGLDKVEALLEGSDATYLACNISYHGEGDGALSKVKPYEIMEYGDTKVGFVGVVTPRTLNENREAFFKENGEVVYDFCGEDEQEFFDCVQENVDACKGEGADYIVLLSHLGDTEDKKPFTSVELIQNTTGIDVVLDAHSHSVIREKTERNANGEDVILSSGGSDFSHFGQLTIQADGEIKTRLISSYLNKDEEVKELVEDIKYYYESDWAQLNKLIKKEVSGIYYAESIEKPENIILMIGDGMGYNIVEATEKLYADKLEDETLYMNKFPVQGSGMTYSTSDSITDSAAGATALATGFKTSNKTVSMDENDENAYKTILEIAHESGKSTGVVATKYITDATPAAFTTHAAERELKNEIGAQQLSRLADGTLDLCLGGGQQYYTAYENREVMEQAVNSGVTYTESWKEAKKSELPLAGLFGEENMDTTDKKVPKIAEMTEFALDKLSEDEDGFFLMIEGSQIDTYGEANNFDQQLEEVYDFDRAVKSVMDFVEENPDTVVIVTADHETGGLQLPAKLTEETKNMVYYTTGKHTNRVVPIRAYGYRTEELEGIHENTDIAIFMASLLGVEEFGQTSISHKLNTDLEGLSEISNTRAIHVSVKNEGDRVEAPALLIAMADKRGTAYCQTGYVEKGGSVVLSYVLPDECWNNNGENPLLDLDFYDRNGQNTDLVIEGYEVTSRVRGR